MGTHLQTLPKSLSVLFTDRYSYWIERGKTAQILLWFSIHAQSRMQNGTNNHPLQQNILSGEFFLLVDSTSHTLAHYRWVLMSLTSWGTAVDKVVELQSISKCPISYLSNNYPVTLHWHQSRGNFTDLSMLYHRYILQGANSTLITAKKQWVSQIREKKERKEEKNCLISDFHRQ